MASILEVSEWQQIRRLPTIRPSGLALTVAIALSAAIRSFSKRTRSACGRPSPADSISIKSASRRSAAALLVLVSSAALSTIYGVRAVPIFFTLEGLVVDPFGTVYIPDKTDGSLSQPTIGRSKRPPKACPLLLWAAFLFALTRPVLGQDYTIQTEVGRGWNLPGISANLPLTQGVAIDGSGNVFIVLTDDSVVVRMDSTGQLTLLAGNGTPGFSGDGGPAAIAQLSYPTAAGTDAAGNVYILDNGNHRIREVSNGVINTVAGGGSNFYAADNGPATSADLSDLNPNGLAVDSAGSFYFTAGNIRKVSNGVITTVAGGGLGLGDNVPATSAFIAPAGLAIDAAGNLYYADTCYNRIRKISNGIVSTVAGNGKPVPDLLGFGCAPSVAGPDTGTATSVTLNGPQGVAVDTAGNVYFMESAPSFGARARQVSKGIVTTVAGGNPSVLGTALGDDIPATSAVLYLVAGIAVDTAGNLYIPDNYGPFEIGRLRQVSNGTITTIAGASGVSGDNGPATGAQLNFPASVAVDTQGSLYIVDFSNNVVRKVSSGSITTIAGNRSIFHDSGSGPATSLSLYGPEGVAVDSAGNVYIADTGNVRIVELSGGVFTTAATDVYATSIALDADGDLYFADSGGNRIGELSNGAVITIAGGAGAGFSGDNGPAANAQLSGPAGIAVDTAGNIYFADVNNQRVRKISKGIISTVAGNGTPGFSGDNGPATNAQLNLSPFQRMPSGIAPDASGNLYIVDTANQRIRKVSNGTITTVAGNGTSGYSGDNGPAASAQFDNPFGIATDTAGRFYVADSSNGRIRVLAPPPGPQPLISLVANAFGDNPAIASNTWVEIKGLNLAPPGDSRIWQASDFVNNQMPTALDGVSVTMGGGNAYIYSIGAGQINVLTPPDLNPGPVQVQVTVGGAMSAPSNELVLPISPSFFVYNGGPYVIAVHADSSRIGPVTLYPGLTTPAKPGEVILLFANGFGPTVPPIASGSASQSGNLPALPQVTIGGVAATVLSAALISPGLYQFNVVVPVSLPDGDNTIAGSYSGAITQPGTLLTLQH